MLIIHKDKGLEQSTPYVYRDELRRDRLVGSKLRSYTLGAYGPNYPVPALALHVVYESDGRALVVEDYTNKWAYEYLAGWEYPLLSPFVP